MSDSCLNCGGLIMSPNQTYGYAGPVCNCPKNPAYLYQRPASKEQAPPLPADNEWGNIQDSMKKSERITALEALAKQMAQSLQDIFDSDYGNPITDRISTKALEAYKRGMGKVECAHESYISERGLPYCKKCHARLERK